MNTGQCLSWVVYFEDEETVLTGNTAPYISQDLGYSDISREGPNQLDPPAGRYEVYAPMTCPATPVCRNGTPHPISLLQQKKISALSFVGR